MCQFNLEQHCQKLTGLLDAEGKIMSVTGNKHSVRFYGTGEISNLLAKNLFDYFNHKKALTKENKRPFFKDGLVEIDAEISKMLRVSNDQALDKEKENTAGTDRGAKINNSNSNDANVPLAVADELCNSPTPENETNVSKTTPGKKTSPRLSEQGLVSPKSEPRSPITEVSVNSDRTTPKRYFNEDTARTPLSRTRRTRSRILSPSAEEKVFPYTLPFSPTAESSTAAPLTMTSPIVLKKVSVRLERTVSAYQDKPTTIISDEFPRISDAERDRRSFLVAELRMLELDYRIKSSLCVDSPDPASCTMLLTQLNALEIRPLMLLKNPGVVDTIVKTAHYVGNGVNHDMPQKNDVIFFLMSAKVRKLSEQCINKFTRFFHLETGETFLEKFSKLLDRFKICTAHLTLIEIMQMVDEPFEMSPPTAVKIKLDGIDAIKVETDDKDKQKGKTSEKIPTEIPSTPKTRPSRGVKRRLTRECRRNSHGK